MKALQLLCLLISVLGVPQLCHGLTCTSKTANTCKESLFVSGECVAGNCQCQNDTVPSGIGCHDTTKQKPTVTGEFPSGYGDVEESEWSGEADSNYMKFTCNPSTFKDGSYEWLRNGIPVKKAHNKVLQMHVGPGISRFQCRINTYGSVTAKSDAFVMKVINNGAPFTVKPKVAGIPTFAANNSGLRLSCVNIPSFMGVFVFTVDGKEYETLHHSRSKYIEMTEDTLNKQVTCTVKPEGGTPSITSDPVSTPATFTDELPDVIIKGRNHFYDHDRSIQITCEFVESFAPGDRLTYKWTGPNPDHLYQTSHNYFKLDTELKDSGIYTCSVTYKNVTKTSPGFEITIEQLGVYSISAQPERPVLGGYMSLTCRTWGSNLPSPQYKWDFLAGHTDNVVQFNDIKVTDFGMYVRCGTTARNVYGHAMFIPAPLPMSDVIQPTIEIASDSDKPDMYTLTCKSDYFMPGGRVDFDIDDVTHTGAVIQKDESSVTFNYSQSLNNSVNAKCRLIFDNDMSKWSSSCSIPRNGSIATPVIQVRDSPTVFISGTSYVLYCSCLRYTDATYSWKKNGDYVFSSFAPMLQLVTNETSGNYTCTVSIFGGESKESEPFEIIVVDEIPVPTIEIVASPDVHRTDNQIMLQKGSTYYLQCSSPAHHELTRYNWKSGSRWQGVPERILRLHDVQVYTVLTFTCTIDLGGKSVESKSVTFNVGDLPSLKTTTVSPLDGSPSVIPGSVSYALAVILAVWNFNKLMNNS